MPIKHYTRRGKRRIRRLSRNVMRGGATEEIHLENFDSDYNNFSSFSITPPPGFVVYLNKDKDVKENLRQLLQGGYTVSGRRI